MGEKVNLALEGMPAMKKASVLITIANDCIEKGGSLTDCGKAPYEALKNLCDQIPDKEKPQVLSSVEKSCGTKTFQKDLPLQDQILEAVIAMQKVIYLLPCYGPMGFRPGSVTSV